MNGDDHYAYYCEGAKHDGQVLSVIFSRVIRKYDQRGCYDPDDTRHHINIKCCSIALRLEPCLESLRRRLGYKSYIALIEHLELLEWSEDEVYLKTFLEVHHGEMLAKEAREQEVARRLATNNKNH